MPKTKKSIAVHETELEEVQDPAMTVSKSETCQKISSLDLSMGREDLNLLVAKVNELIEAHNQCQSS